MIRFDLVLNDQRGNCRLQAAASIDNGTLLALSGPSGAGKTTLLRLLAGLEQPTRGWIEVDDHAWCRDGRQCLASQKRRLGMVFQDFALFPHLSVRDNIAFSRGPKTLVDELIGQCQLEAVVNERPAQLSGGQRQRVALARALASQPRLLLLDEPLSALDQPLRVQLRQLIARLHRQMGLTTVLVSHDAGEIQTLASEVWTLEHGHLVAATTTGGQGQIGASAGLDTQVISVSAGSPCWQVVVRCGEQTWRLPASAGLAATLTPGQRLRVSLDNMQLVTSAPGERLPPRHK